MKTILKKAAQCFFAVLFVLAAANMATAASPLSIKVTHVELGPVSGGKQSITFWYTVKNITSHEYFSRLNNVTVKITGRYGNDEETYQRKVDINYNFNPALGPGKSKQLKTTFTRRVNSSKGWYPYSSVRVNVLKYNFKRAS